MSPLKLTIVVLALAVGFGTASLAGAAKKKPTETTSTASESIEVKTKVTIKLSQAPGFHGEVSSASYPLCSDYRKIRLYRESAGGDVLAGQTTAGEDGTWDFAPKKKSGSFFVVVPQKQFVGGPLYICKRAKSKPRKAG